MARESTLHPARGIRVEARGPGGRGLDIVFCTNRSHFLCIDADNVPRVARRHGK